MVRVFQKLAVMAAVYAVPMIAGEMRPEGVRNFHKVNDSVYRGAQPSDEGFRSLARIGVKTVIDLRREDEHSTELEREAVEAAGMRYVNVPMQGIVAPAEYQIANILSLLDSKEPTFVHCKEGKDRTGVVMAAYRMSHDGWTNDQAMREANSFGMHWYEMGIKSYIMSYRSGPAPAETEAKLDRRTPQDGAEVR